MPEPSNRRTPDDASLRTAYDRLDQRYRRQAEELRAIKQQLKQSAEALEQAMAEPPTRHESQDAARRHAIDPAHSPAKSHLGADDSRQIAEALRESEERYRSLVELAPDSIVTMDLQGRITSTNAAACGVTGYTADEVLGKPFWKLGVFRFRDIPKYLRIFYSMIRGKLPGPVELECYSKDGTKQFVEARVGFLKRDERIVGFQVVSRNITDRKTDDDARLREQVFRNAIIECAAEGLCVCHATPEFPFVEFTVWNRRMTELTGHTMEQINRLGWYQSIYPDPEVQAKAAARMAAMRMGDNLVGEEWEITRADGQTRTVRISTTLLADESGAPHVLALMYDITERKEAEDLSRIQHELALALAACHNLEAGLRLCLDAAIRATRLDCGGFHLVDEQTGSLDLFASRGVSDDFARSTSHYDAGTPHARLVGAGRPFYSRFADLPIELTEVERREGLRFVAVIPMRHEGRVIGCLNMASHTADDISPAARTALETIAAGAVQAIIRLRAEAALRRSEERLRLVLEASNDGLWDADLRADRAYLSPKYYELVGYRPGEITPNLDFYKSLIHPDDYVRVRQTLKADLYSPVGESAIEHRIVAKDGAVRWILAKAKVVERDAAGEPLRVVGTISDITDRKRAEDALQRQQAFLDAVLDNAHTGIIACDADGKIVLLNRTIRRLHNVPGEGVPAERWADHFDLYRADGTTRMPTDELPLVRALRGEQIRDVEVVVAPKSGSPRVHLVSGSPLLGADGALHGAVVSTYDVTEHRRAEDALRRSEEELRLVLEASGTGWWRLDFTSGEVFGDDRCKELLGLPLSTEPKIEAFFDLISPEDQARVLQTIAEASARPGDHEGEYCVAWPDGSRHWILLRGRSYHNAQGRPLSFGGIVMDVTARKRAEEALRASEENFRAFFNTVDDCLFVVSPEGTILRINETVTRKLGFREDELIGRSVGDVHPEDCREEAARIIAEMVAGRADFCPLPLLSKTGRRVPAETRVVPGKWDERDVLFGVSKDLSEIHALQERFAKAFHANPSPMAITSLDDTRFLDVNDAFVRMTGYAREEALDFSSQELDLFAQPAQREAAMDQLQKTGRFRDFEAELRTKDGQIRHGLFSGETMQLQDRQVLLTVMTDVTQRKQAEELLRESVSRLQATLESTADGILVVDLQGRIVDLNERFLEMWRIPKEVIAAGRQRDLIASAGAEQAMRRILDTLKDPDGFVAKVAELYTMPEASSFDVLEWKDGQVFERYSQPQWIGGRPVGRVWSFRDVTQRKHAEDALRESEEHYRLLVETIPQIAWRSSPDASVLEFNSRWFEYTGQTPEDVSDRGWLAAVHPDDQARVADGVAQAVSTGNPFRVEGRLRRGSDGSYRWHLGRAVPLLGANGEILSWFGAATDVEDLKQAQQALETVHDEELKRHRMELAHVGRLSMMGEMAANLAHELNQPLHAVTNYARGSVRRVLKMREKDEELVAVLEQIAVEANRAAEIVRRVRRFVQKDAPEFADVSVNSLIEDVLLLNKGELELAQVAVERDFAANLPTVSGDPIQIQQVLMNLVRNALDSMAEAPPEDRALRITTAWRDDGTVLVEVCDRGDGIAPDDMPKIFEPFFTTKPEGMGMGLAISRSIVKAHRGRLWASANRERGCTFSFTLPTGRRS